MDKDKIYVDFDGRMIADCYHDNPYLPKDYMEKLKKDFEPSRFRGEFMKEDSKILDFKSLIATVNKWSDPHDLASSANNRHGTMEFTCKGRMDELRAFSTILENGGIFKLLGDGNILADQYRELLEEVKQLRQLIKEPKKKELFDIEHFSLFDGGKK